MNMRYGHTDIRNNGVTEEQGSSHTLGILMEEPRSSLGAGKEPLRVSLEHTKAENSLSATQYVGCELPVRRERTASTSGSYCVLSAMSLV